MHVYFYGQARLDALREQPTCRTEHAQRLYMRVCKSLLPRIAEAAYGQQKCSKVFVLHRALNIEAASRRMVVSQLGT